MSKKRQSKIIDQYFKLKKPDAIFSEEILLFVKSKTTVVTK
jgi:N-acetylneuraminic acid mutarotase